MAVFGAQYPCFAPFDGAESDSAAPTYKNGVVLGELVSANLTVTNASGEIWGDDKQVERIEEFASGAIPMETVDITDEAASTVYGATVNENEVHFKVGDEAPYGGLAYFKSLIRKGKKSYKAYFYPKAKAAIGSDNAQTKGSSITFQSTTTNFSIAAPLHDDTAWMVYETFDTIAEAKAWIHEKLNMLPMLASATIIGTPEPAEVLSLSLAYSTGQQLTPDLTYKWQSSVDDDDYTDISLATSATYTVKSGDVGKYIRCVVTASGSATGTVTTAGVLVDSGL